MATSTGSEVWSTMAFSTPSRLAQGAGREPVDRPDW